MCCRLVDNCEVGEQLDEMGGCVNFSGGCNGGGGGGDGGGKGGEKSSLMVLSQAKMILWMTRGMTTLLIWICVVQLLTVGEVWGPRLLKTWPSCYTTPYQTNLHSPFMESRVFLPPKRAYKNNGYLMVSCNGGLNQMRGAICDMVAVARYLNVTLIVPELDKSSFWADPSDFEDIFDVDHFIKSLRDEVRILKELPPRLKRRVELGKFHSLAPISWSDISYYHHQILPLIRRYKVVHLNRTDARLANNGLPLEIQKLRCRVNFSGLRFTSQIEELGRKVVNILRKNGPFLVLHLRYEMDMLAFSGCTQGCNGDEIEELTRMRYAYPWWKEKEIDSDFKRKEGLCPMTPEETTLILRALRIDRNIQIYIAAGEIYGGERRMASLATEFPNLVRKEMLLDRLELGFFQNHSSQMAALDYYVSLESDIFVPTYDGNMARVVEGHRRYMPLKISFVAYNTIGSFGTFHSLWALGSSRALKPATWQTSVAPEPHLFVALEWLLSQIGATSVCGTRATLWELQPLWRLGSFWALKLATRHMWLLEPHCLSVSLEPQMWL